MPEVALFFLSLCEYKSNGIYLINTSSFLLKALQAVDISQSCLSFLLAKLLQLCPTLCDAVDGSPLGSSVPGILQARTLEWVAISFFNA